MARRFRTTPRKPRKKVVKVQYLPRPAKKVKPGTTGDNPYTYVDYLIQQHHEDLRDAKVAVAWMLDVKADKDGHLVLGKCKKASDLDREFRDFDIVVLLNAEAWKQLDDKQRAALVDHELCHATEQCDKNGEPVLDERDRKVYRMRKHDIEEFTCIVKRYGTYKSDLEEFVRQAIQAPLFADQANGEATEKGEAAS
jgi:hypothetical protein